VDNYNELIIVVVKLSLGKFLLGINIIWLRINWFDLIKKLNTCMILIVVVIIMIIIIIILIVSIINEFK